MTYTSIDQACARLERDKPILLVCPPLGLHQETPTRSYLLAAAARATTENLEFLKRHGDGRLGIALPPEHLESLGMPAALVASPRQAEETTADLTAGARMLRELADPRPRSLEGLRLPAWIFPSPALWGGVLVSATPADASVDLARLAGLAPVGVWSAFALAGNGSLEAFRAHHDLAVIALDELIRYRRERVQVQVSPQVTRVRLPTRFGNFEMRLFEELLTGYNHLALVLGEVDTGEPVLTRIHSECFTGDVLSSLRCDCGDQLNLALWKISRAGRGVLLYLRQEGRGIGLRNKLRAYALQDKGLDTIKANEQLGFPADLRDFEVAGKILSLLGVREVELMTNNTHKVEGLERHGIAVARRISLFGVTFHENRHYLTTKKEKLGHLLDRYRLAKTDRSASLGRTTNLSILFTAPGELEVRDQPIPQPAAGEVLIRTLCSLISPGTEPALLSDEVEGSGRRETSHFPHLSGFSNVGEVVAVGRGVASEWLGTRVHSHGGHQAFTTAPEDCLCRIEDVVSDEDATFTTLAKVTMNGLRRGNVAWGESVGIVGMGLYGQLASRLCAIAGVRPVFAIDPSPSKLSRVPADPRIRPLRGNPDELVEVIAAMNGGRLLDVLIEETGGSDPGPGHPPLLAPKGRLLLLGSPLEASRYDFHSARHGKSFVILGAHGLSHPPLETPDTPWTARRHGELFLQLLAEGEVSSRELVTHRFAAAEAGKAYELLRRGREEALGVVLEW